ncbi:unnamed protein product [Dicrocoelium dendriticum]|nr:unnamed protein product [Dicrocoelium dendriticum]
MSSCLRFIRIKRKHNKEIYLALLGLDNAGKTTIARTIRGISSGPITPTIGFDRVEFTIDRFNVNLYDLGGGRTIRAIWQTYFGELHGVIYVVDATAAERLLECKTVLRKLLAHPSISGKPVLLLANKRDATNALDESELIEALQLDDLVNEFHCPCRLECCCALPKPGRRLDKSIRLGLQWLLAYIASDLTNLDARISTDLAKQAGERSTASGALQDLSYLTHEKRKRLGVQERNTEDQSGDLTPHTNHEDVSDLEETYAVKENRMHQMSIHSERKEYESSRRLSSASLPPKPESFMKENRISPQRSYAEFVNGIGVAVRYPKFEKIWQKVQLIPNVERAPDRKRSVTNQSDNIKIEELDGFDEVIQELCRNISPHHMTRVHANGILDDPNLDNTGDKMFAELSHEQSKMDDHPTFKGITSMSNLVASAEHPKSAEQVVGLIPLVVTPLYGRLQRALSETSTSGAPNSQSLKTNSPQRKDANPPRGPSPLSRIFTPGINKLHPADHDSRERK